MEKKLNRVGLQSILEMLLSLLKCMMYALAIKVIDQKMQIQLLQYRQILKIEKIFEKTFQSISGRSSVESYFIKNCYNFNSLVNIIIYGFI